MHGQRDENDRAGQRGQADQRMKDKADGEIERHPRQVEQRNRAEAGQKRADGVEIAQRLHAVAAAADASSGRRTIVSINAAAERLVERAADAHQNAAADQVEQAERREQSARQHDEPTSVGTLRLGSTRS